jgi:hypothetical protein
MHWRSLLLFALAFAAPLYAPTHPARLDPLLDWGDGRWRPPCPWS